LRDWLESRNFIQIIYKFYRNGSILQKKDFRENLVFQTGKKHFYRNGSILQEKRFQRKSGAPNRKKARVSMRGLMFHCN
jgi:hypothetical protein